MKVHGLHIQSPGTTTGNLLELLRGKIQSQQYSTAMVCAAYATFRGIKLIRELVNRAPSPVFRWLLGTDDYVTQPQALALAREAKN